MTTTVAADTNASPAPPGARTAGGGRLGWLVAAVAGAGFLALSWRLRGYVADDAWISVRYAENLAAGHGLVWNPGGDPVEGYSNPLLVALEALAVAVGWSALGAARVIGVLCGLGCVVLVYAQGRHVVGETAARTAALLTGFSAPFALWSVGGLETTAVALVITAAVLELARPDGGRPVLAGCVLALLPWLRPEGLAIALALAVLGEIGALRRKQSRRAALTRALAIAGIPLLSQAALELQRWLSFGHLLPNSVMYKVGTGDSLDVATKFFSQTGLLLILALLGLALARGRQRLVAVPPLVYLAGSVGALDSANGWSRFLMPIWPQVAVLVAVTVVAAARALRFRWAAVLLAAALVVGQAVVLPARLVEVDRWQQLYMSCRAGARENMADWLQRNLGPDGSFAIADAGLVPARAGVHNVIDSFMLNDPRLQDTGPLPYETRADMVLRSRPDVLVLASLSASELDAVYPTDDAIHEHPGMDEYRLAYVASGSPGTCPYNLMAFLHSPVG